MVTNHENRALHVQADDMLDEREAAAYLGISASAMRKWRARQCGPKYARLGRIIRYRQSDMDAFVESRIIAADSSEHE